LQGKIRQNKASRRFGLQEYAKLVNHLLTDGKGSLHCGLHIRRQWVFHSARYPLVEALRTRHDCTSFSRSDSRHGKTQLFPPLNRANATPQIGSDFLPAIQNHCLILYLSGMARNSRLSKPAFALIELWFHRDAKTMDAA
jgi:hypothetical protein